MSAHDFTDLIVGEGFVSCENPGTSEVARQITHVAQSGQLRRPDVAG